MDQQYYPVHQADNSECGEVSGVVEVWEQPVRCQHCHPQYTVSCNVIHKNIPARKVQSMPGLLVFPKPCSTMS